MPGFSLLARLDIARSLLATPPSPPPLGVMSLEDGIPYPTNGLLKMTLLPALQVVNLGARKNNLDMGDLWRLRKAEAAQVAWKQFLPHWERQLRATEYVHGLLHAAEANFFELNTQSSCLAPLLALLTRQLLLIVVQASLLLFSAHLPAL